MIARTDVAGTVFCLASKANVHAISRDGERVCSRCGERNHPVTLPDSRDRTSVRYQTNLAALTAIQKLWKCGVHGDDGIGWVDVEFKDLVTAASFTCTLRDEIQAVTILRDPVAFLLGKAVVITFPIPDDRDLFGTP